MRLLVSVVMPAFIGTYFWKIPPTEAQELIGWLMLITGFVGMLAVAMVSPEIMTELCFRSLYLLRNESYSFLSERTPRFVFLLD